MEKIPPSLVSQWNTLAKDGSIDKKDFAKLEKAAANGSKDYDLREREFLFKLEDKLENSGGKIPAKPIENIKLFTDI